MNSSIDNTVPAQDAVAILHTASDAVIVAGADGTITYWNPGAERIFGYSAGEAVGQSLDLIIPERLRQRHWTAWDKVVGGAPSRYGAEDLLSVPSARADGTALSVEFTITVLHHQDGSIRAIAAVLRDATKRFTEMRELRQRLAAAEQSSTTS